MAYDVLTFGEALVEIMRPAVKQPLDRPGPFVGPYPSGAPFIFAAQAARLGAQVGVIGAVGNDAFGRCLLDQLHADGIDTRGVRILPDRTTGVAFVAYAADGSREFVFHIRDAAAGQLAPDLIDLVLFEGLRALHLMGSTLSIHAEALAAGHLALTLAQSAGAKISFDPNLRPQLLSPDKVREVFAPFVEAADVLLPTIEEARLLTGESMDDTAIAALLHAGNNPDRIVIVTRGAAGCDVYTHTGNRHVPGFPVTEVDPTGAGDCFDAGFLVRWLAGDSPMEAARFANACGALAVTVRGPMAGAQKYGAVRTFIEQNEAKIND
ncbi:MAG: sugar kinase [Aggregatilineales bacterium]